jgi:ribosomal protein S27E
MNNRLKAYGDFGRFIARTNAQGEFALVQPQRCHSLPFCFAATHPLVCCRACALLWLPLGCPWLLRPSRTHRKVRCREVWGKTVHESRPMAM